MMVPLLGANEALLAVGRDLEDGFAGVFEAIKSPSAVGVFADGPVGTTGISVMEWEWAVRHVGSLQGTPATGREVMLRGVTIIHGRDGELLFSRYIDWLALYADLGAVTIARPLVDDRKRLPVEDNIPFPGV